MATTAINLPVSSRTDEVVTERTYRHRSHLRVAAVEVIIATAMAVAAGLLLWGASFGRGMVHDNLADQQISFPAVAGLPDATRAELTKYAGQAVDNGAKAKAYANLFIGEHLKDVNGGKTYSQTSSDQMAAQAKLTAMQKANPNDPAIAQQQQVVNTLNAQKTTLFQGETLRGLLLYAWGWSLVSDIAFYVGIVAVIGALLLFALAGFGFFQARRDNRIPATS